MLDRTKRVKATLTTYQTKLAIVIDGKTAWESVTYSGGNAPGMVQVPNGKTAAETLQRFSGSTSVGHLLTMPVPKYIPKLRDQTGFGTSKLTVRGVESETPKTPANAPGATPGKAPTPTPPRKRP